MDGHIGRLHCRYKVIGPPGSIHLAERLDRVVRRQLAGSLEKALDQGLGDDPTVYVLRRIDARLSLNVERGLADDLLARRWSEGLAGAVVRGIASGIACDSGDGANLVRFAGQAEYVASFVVDLLRDRAWDCWYYGAFQNLRSRGKEGAVGAVLLAYREHLPAILARLRDEGALEALLALLDRETLEALWKGLGGLPGAAPEAARPLFAAAFGLAGRLELWTSAPPSRSAAEALLRDWAAAGGRAVDWRDARGLAAAVLDALRFLARRSLLRQPAALDGPAVRERLAAAQEELGWLDLPWLEESLTAWLGSPAPPADLPARPSAAGLTPRQRELLADLEEILSKDSPDPAQGQSGSLADAVRIYALLVAHAPRWRGDPLATGMIQRLLDVRARLLEAGLSREALAYLRGGTPAPPLPRAHEALRLLAGLGDAGLRVALLLLLEPGRRAAPPSLARKPEMPTPAPVPRPGESCETACAGLFLLLRTIRDLRLPALLGQPSWPPAGLGLAALGLRLAGSAALDGDRIDPGLALFAGLEEPLTLDGLREAWAAAGPDDGFQAGLLRTLAGQRLATGSELRLYRVPLGDGGRALVAGPAGAELWPLGRCVGSSVGEGLAPSRAGASPAPTLPAKVNSIADAWEEATGLRPALTIRREGRRKLLQSLDALRAGRLGLPGPDLTLGLAALALLRVWARWLRGFSASSAPFLLEQWIRRGGRLHAGDDGLRVEIDPAPLDAVLEMAGYTRDLETPGERPVRFRRSPRP
jgi:hypothetical protein